MLPAKIATIPKDISTLYIHQKIWFCSVTSVCPGADGITARFYESGHILGSTSIELIVQENGSTKVIVFSGDLGPYEQPIVHPFEQLPYANLVFLEATYGNRNHRPYTETIKEFEQIILKAVEQKGKILISAFAIGRTQQILYQLAILFFQKRSPLFLSIPSTVFWTVCTTDAYSTGLDEDSYFTMFNRRKHGSSFPPDTGFELGVFSCDDMSVEAGIDYLGGTDDPLFFNIGANIPEDKMFCHGPSFKLVFLMLVPVIVGITEQIKTL